jgi:hypothetical protein
MFLKDGGDKSEGRNPKEIREFRELTRIKNMKEQPETADDRLSGK